MRSKEKDLKKAVKLLEKDLTNGLLHCFGYHDKCSTDFCKAVKEKGLPPNNGHDADIESCQTSDDIEGMIS